MKVAYLVNQYPKVSHSFIRREIKGLEAIGIEVSRFSVRPGEAVDPMDLEEKNCTQVILAAGYFALGQGVLQQLWSVPFLFLKALKLTLAIGWKSERGLARHFVYLAEACLLKQWLLEGQIAHLHAHFGTNSAAVAMLCHVLGGPTYSFTIHGPEEFDKPLSIYLSTKINHALFVVAISHFGKSQIYRWCTYDQWTKIHVIHCGVDEQFLEGRLAIPDNSTLVCVGRLCEQKGQLLLLEAIAQLVQAGVAVDLILVGDGPLRPAIEAMIQELGLQQRVKITGWASAATVKQHILDARAFVLPSFAEGLPVVLMEAMALGRPVITTTVAGIPELVEFGKTGWLVPAGSVENLAIAIQEALTCPVEELEAMSQRGLLRVTEQHNAKVEAAKLAKLFADYTRCSPETPVLS